LVDPLFTASPVGSGSILTREQQREVTARDTRYAVALGTVRIGPTSFHRGLGRLAKRSTSEPLLGHITQPVALPADADHGYVMHQAIKNRPGKHGVSAKLPNSLKLLFEVAMKMAVS
jgi:hypothetical protein